MNKHYSYDEPANRFEDRVEIDYALRARVWRVILVLVVLFWASMGMAIYHALKG